MGSQAVVMALALATAAPAGGFSLSGTTYVAVPALERARGTRLEVNDLTGIYTLVDGARRFSVVPGFDVARVDGRPVAMEGPALFRDGELVVPATLLVPPRAAGPAVGEIPLKKVILDPGHGGSDCGALGPARLREKDVTLSVALRLKELLEARGVEVLMTRRTDRFLQLAERSELANRSGADAFLSIHCNAASSRRVSGAETFALTWSVSDAVRVRKASARLDPGDLVDGAAERVGRAAEQAIFSAYLGEQRRQSSALARCVQAEMVRCLGEEDRGVKLKNFSVLRETYVPAALAEVGFITDRTTEERMRSAAWRQKIAEALAAGLGRYARAEAERRERIAGSPAPAGPEARRTLAASRM